MPVEQTWTRGPGGNGDTWVRGVVATSTLWAYQPQWEAFTLPCYITQTPKILCYKAHPWAEANIEKLTPRIDYVAAARTHTFLHGIRNHQAC